MADLIRWQDKFRTGIVDVDYEHQELVELINKLYVELQSSARADAVRQFFGDLHKAISSHFALEETLMKSADYPNYPVHKDDHEDLLDELRAIMEDYENAPESVSVDVLGKVLDTWFTEHFRTHDAKLHKVMGPH